ncbi:Cobalt-precorrin-2 C(20)-methyltransferase [hydrothermal vent metagenome]|uniref:Cobalt-precorrin-2 C(20)-methyltransferase n=1 Tax=hydrothermal vent metagenome TaxID=652676 RepID=A0A3B1CT65_9ZZZZ
MKLGALYGVGVGPGDPELVSVKGVRLIGACPHLFTPKARVKAESVAFQIAGRYISVDTQVHELVFPMVKDESELKEKWDISARAVANALEKGEDACFITIGDPFLYSTYIYLVRSLKEIHPEVTIVTVPGITAYSAVASLTSFPVGEGEERVAIIPASYDLGAVRRAISMGGTIILMKVGKNLKNVLALLEEMDVIDDAVFAGHAGMKNQRIETDLRKLKDGGDEVGYLSTILVKAANGGADK